MPGLDFYVQYSWIPNAISVSRVGIILFQLLFFYSSYYKVCAILCIFQGLTDAMDGILARNFLFKRKKNVLYNSIKEEHMSITGAWLDQICDKLSISANFVILVEKFMTYKITIPVLLLLLREIIVSGLRELLASYQTMIMRQTRNKSFKYQTLQSTFLAKTKTCFQFATVVILFYVEKTDGELMQLGYFLLYTSCILSYISAAQYVKTVNHVFETTLNNYR